MDENTARHLALEIAVREASAGTNWDTVIGNANKFAAFIINGTVPADETSEAE